MSQSSTEPHHTGKKPSARIAASSPQWRFTRISYSSQRSLYLTFDPPYSFFFSFSCFFQCCFSLVFWTLLLLYSVRYETKLIPTPFWQFLQKWFLILHNSYVYYYATVEREVYARCAQIGRSCHFKEGYLCRYLCRACKIEKTYKIVLIPIVNAELQELCNDVRMGFRRWKLTLI